MASSKSEQEDVLDTYRVQIATRVEVMMMQTMMMSRDMHMRPALEGVLMSMLFQLNS